MSTADLKINLINTITKLNDVSLIEGIQRLIDFESDKREFKLTPEQQARISEAKEEYRLGKTLSDTETDHEILEWLKE